MAPSLGSRICANYFNGSKHEELAILIPASASRLMRAELSSIQTISRAAPTSKEWLCSLTTLKTALSSILLASGLVIRSSRCWRCTAGSSMSSLSEPRARPLTRLATARCALSTHFKLIQVVAEIKRLLVIGQLLWIES